MNDMHGLLLVDDVRQVTSRGNGSDIIFPCSLTGAVMI